MLSQGGCGNGHRERGPIAEVAAIFVALVAACLLVGEAIARLGDRKRFDGGAVDQTTTSAEAIPHTDRRFPPRAPLHLVTVKI